MLQGVDSNWIVHSSFSGELGVVPGHSLYYQNYYLPYNQVLFWPFVLLLVDGSVVLLMVLLSNSAEVEVLHLELVRVELSCFVVDGFESSVFSLTPFVIGMKGLFTG